MRQRNRFEHQRSKLEPSVDDNCDSQHGIKIVFLPLHVCNRQRYGNAVICFLSEISAPNFYFVFSHFSIPQIKMALNQNAIMNALDWAYEKAVNGVPGLDSAQEMATDYLKGEESLSDKANSLIRWQNTKAATSGFLTGLGGVVTMPITIPANITSVLYVQIRMIAAIAHMGGYDLKDDRVKSLVYACLCGSAATEIIRDIGIKVGTKITEKAIEKISSQLIIKINQAVGFRLLTKFGQTGMINIAKAVPLAGGFVGAAFDSVATNTIGNIARDTFIPA